MNRNDETTQQLAEALVRGTASLPENLSSEDRLVLAWALKDFATSAWASNPPDVVTTADALDSLVNVGIPEPSNSQTETEAIAAWVRGLALLTKGEAALAIDSLDNAAAEFSSIAQTTNAAHTQSAKMMALSQIGKDDLAIETGLTAYETLSIAHEALAAAKISLNLGNLLWNRGAYADSLLRYERAQTAFRQLGHAPLEAAANLGRTNSLATLGRFDEALEQYAAAKAVCEESSLLTLEAVVVEWRAHTQLARGRYSEALQGLEAARSRYESLELQQNLALVERQLADTYFELGLTGESCRLFEQAIPRFEALSMHTELGWTFVQLASARALADVSAPEIDAFLSNAERIFSSQRLVPGEASVALAYARVAFARKRYDVAVARSRQSSAAFAEIGHLRQRLQADVVLSKALLKVGQTKEAADLLLSTLSSAREKQLSSVAIECHQALGDIEYAAGARNNAREHFTIAVSISEGVRGALSSDRMRSAFLDDRLRAYKQLLAIALDDYEEIASNEHLISAFANAERLRARALLERLGETQIGGSNKKSESQAASLRARLNWTQRKLQKLADEGEIDEALATEAARLEHELLELYRRDEIATVRETRGANSDGSDLTSSLSQMGKKTLLVEYVVLDDELFAFVARDGDIALRRRIASWQSVLDLIEALRFQLETMRYGSGTMQSHGPRLVARANQVLGKLYSQLWAPLGISLTNIDQVIISPTGGLAAVPFCALFDSTTNHYLGEHVAISYTPSASLIAQLHSAGAATTENAVVIAETSRLTHAAEEAELVRTTIVGTRVFAGDHATIKQLRDASRQADLLHLACHASFRSDNPSFSALQLTDGPFTVFDAEALRLDRATVVLSACETATAEDTAGDEMFGLVRGFMVGGAARVVASLWAIDDETTKRFMPPFYQTLAATGSHALALQKAQLTLMKTHPHPFHWAAFVAYGAP